jgi:hypothetical protein
MHEGPELSDFISLFAVDTLFRPTLSSYYIQFPFVFLQQW